MKITTRLAVIAVIALGCVAPVRAQESNKRAEEFLKKMQDTADELKSTSDQLTKTMAALRSGT